MIYATVVQTLALLSFVALAAGVGLLAALAVPGVRTSLRDVFRGQEQHPLAWAWVVAAVAMGGSLYFFEVTGLLPCQLCWYQRIAMYPLVLVLGVGVVSGEPGAWRYALPLPLVGILISIYHVVIQFMPAAEVTTCGGGVPCSARYVAVFGFVSIPWMAGAAFLLIIALLVLVAVVAAGDEPGDDAEDGAGDAEVPAELD